MQKTLASSMRLQQDPRKPCRLSATFLNGLLMPTLAFLKQTISSCMWTLSIESALRVSGHRGHRGLCEGKLVRIMALAHV